MLRTWMQRSGWSLQVFSDLCTAALRATVAGGIQDWSAGEYPAGALVVSDEYVWRAVKATTAGRGPSRPKRAGQRSGVGVVSGDWELVTPLRRIYPSQIHAIERGALKGVSPVQFDAIGVLNLFLADLRSGKRQLSIGEEKLARKASAGLVIEDADGPYGPEEMFAVYLGRLEPPASLYRLTAEQAQEKCAQLARRIRQGMVRAGLDLVDDWCQFVALYPTSDQARLLKVRDVAQGRAQWSAEQVEDEAVAVEIALAKLRRLQSRGGALDGAAEGSA